MSVDASIQMAIKVAETLAMTSLGSDSNGVVHYNLFHEAVLHSGTTPDLDSVWGARVSLSAGDGTIDLAALARTGQTNLDLTGKVVHAWLIHLLAASAAMSFQGGATNPFELFGGATSLINLEPDEWRMGYRPGSTGYGTVAAGAKEIDIAETGTDQFDIVLVAGAA